MERAIVCSAVDKSFGFPPTRVLKSLTFEVEAGEFVAVTGRSGSGKSTLLYIISSLDLPTSGEVSLLGRPINGMPAGELHLFRNRHIGFVFQFHYLLPELTGLENVLMPARRHGLHLARAGRARSLLEQFDVAHCARKLPSQMSGGEMQRVSIARSLIMEPPILFADEPTGNLDSVNGDRVMRIFETINREYGTTIVMVTHERDFAARASRRINMVDGTVESDVRGSAGKKHTGNKRK